MSSLRASPPLAVAQLPARAVWSLIAALVALAPVPAAAFVRTCNTAGEPAYWNHPILPLHTHVGGAPAPLTADQVLRMTQVAAGAWSRQSIPCTQLEIRVVKESSPGTAVKGDGQSTLVFVHEGWTYGAGALALTSTRMRPSDARIIDSDIEVNAQSFTWVDITIDPSATADPDRPLQPQDFQGMLVHEMGHLVGFAHSCDFGDKNPGKDETGQPPISCQTPDDRALRSVMVPSIELAGGFVVPRTLSDDDVRGVCSVYGVVDPQIEGKSLGGCTVTAAPGGGPAGWAAAAMVALLACLRWRRAHGHKRSP